MKSLIQITTLSSLLLFSIIAIGQSIPNFGVRTDINNFSNAEQQLLLDAMMDYITPEIIRMHCSTYQLTNEITPAGLHSDFDFLPFHRVYIEGMEDYLMSQGLSQFVPLPRWDPTDCTPTIFQIVDPDCILTDCAIGGGPTCNEQHNWCPNVTIPPYLSLPENAGNYNDLCDWPFSPTLPGQDDIGGLSRIIEGDNQPIGNPVGSTYHNSVHSNMSNLVAVMGTMASPSLPIFWLWHAFVDDIWKEYEMSCSQSTTLPVDYYMKLHANAMISARDRGEEPAIFNNPLWASEDIWCRNSDDGILVQENQNPISDGVNPVYVYVRIRNRGFQNSPQASGNNQVHLYWAKAATALGWPEYWDGTTTEINQGIPVVMGDEVSSSPKQIPVIDAAGHTIIKFEWYPPDPSDYETINEQPWHFCLLSRVVSNIDPMVNEGTTSLYANVKNNNNIVWKNVSVVDMQQLVGNPDGTWDDEKIVGANVSVGNISNQVKTYDLEFALPDYCGNKKITDEAEVKITMEEDIWYKWVAGGSQAENLVVSRVDRYQVIVTGNPAKLKNLSFAAKERGLIHLSFNYLVENMPFDPEYEYNVVQRDNSTNEIIGGEVFEIISPVRNGFMANTGGDDEILKGDVGRLDAVDIYEPAIYNWYDPIGNLVYTGKDLQVSPTITTTYKLEVIATTDGIKDYDEANVNVLKYAILGISPNPSSTQVNINYLANEANSAYITIMKPYSGISDQYILDVNQSVATVNVSNYPAGTYNVILVCNGQNVDSKTLIIQ